MFDTEQTRPALARTLGIPGKHRARHFERTRWLEDKPMRTTRWLMAAILGLGLVGCAANPVAPAFTVPTPEARQALAPTGKLRVGLQLGSPHNVLRESASGEMRGVGFDLGKELAGRLGVAFEPVLYPSIGALLDGGKSGAWDVAFVGFSPARAKEWDFTAQHMQMEFGYLVPGGSSISTMADVDRSGVRVAVQEKSQPELFLSRTLKNASVVRGSSLPGTLEMMKSGKADAIFSIKPSLFEASNQLPGSRVLDGAAGVDPHAMVMPKGRGPGVAYAHKFIEEAKAEGLVKGAIERAGMRGALVAPRE
jgi:polar amino acid transport system substrate-binding protein